MAHLVLVARVTGVRAGNPVPYLNVLPATNAEDKISLHKFPPKSDILRKTWQFKLGIGKHITENSRVCSLHFLETDFIRTDRRKRRLKSNVVPSKNLPVKSLDERLALLSPQKEKLRKRAERALKRALLFETERIPEVETHEFASSPEYESFFGFQDPEMDKAVQVIPESKDEGIQASYESKDEAVQVTLLDVSKITASFFVKTEAQLSSFCGVHSFDAFYRIADTIDELFIRLNYDVNFKLETREILFITLMKLKTDVTFSVLACLFQISITTCLNYFNIMIDALYLILKDFIKWSSRDEVTCTTPAFFKKYPKTRVILDCSETAIEKINDCLDCEIKTYSHYKSTYTIKYLLGIAPSGKIMFLSPSYGGRASDKFIVKQSGLLDLLEPDDCVMVDKGFDIEEEVLKRRCTLAIPPFMGKKKKLSPAEGQENTDIAKVRVHVERAFQRFKVFRVLKGKFGRNLLAQSDKILTIIGALVNLQAPIISSDEILQ